ncbi:hypothetical protein BDQ12DRAFT_749798 [Crucibulum laeve]|uniref:Nephrocystin 3-like N-terminal domain-containing protein n=1 Tax=Crucibulum laeve TaxID=68775 RepID=A0A5C3LEW8_9AGAR|nr:hypothetical protein BDQ12DRAFT_749798 [Crucibulum laeve]
MHSLQRNRQSKTSGQLGRRSAYTQESTIQSYTESFAKSISPDWRDAKWSNCEMGCLDEWLCDLRTFIFCTSQASRQILLKLLQKSLIQDTHPPNPSTVNVHGGTMTDIRNQTNHYYGTGPQNLYPNHSPVGDASYTRPEPVARCYSGTRLEVIAIIEKWIKDGGDHPVLWLNGPAGSGKSAISQTIAELYKSRICASFFFLRGAGQRSQIQLLIPTLVHQVTLSMPITKEIIQNVLEKSLAFITSKLYSTS